MPTLKLTQLAVDRLKPPGSGRVEYWDSQLPGFGLRVSETGRKTWIALYRVSGKLVRETIGTAALIPKVDEARERARASLLLARGGKNPVAEREERAETERRALDADRTRARNSLGVVLDRYLAERAKLRLRPSTFAEVERALAVDVKQALGGAGMPPLGDRPIADITRRDIRELLDGIVARGKAPHAHHVLAYLRPALAWAVDREIITSNPAEGISDPDPRRREARTRDRYLDDDEVRLFWQACDQLDRPFGPLFKLLLLTGQRREEVAGMRWSELDLVKRVWTLPRGRVKNEKGHVVHLSSLAVKIIEALPKVRSEADLVFTTTGKTAVSGFGRAQQRLAAAMLKLRNADLIEGSDAAAAEKVEIAHFTIHDLRRTTATGMAGIGIAHHVLDKVLNHTSGKISGVGAIYNRFEYFDEREAALAAWARHVETLMGEVPSNLRQLSEARSRRARVSQ